MTPSSKKLPRLPFVLLGLMTAFTFGGPLVIGYVLQGGTNSRWPPDRPIEWFTFLGISGMVLVLMMACFSLLLVNHKALMKVVKSRDQSEVEP
jgi:hypothetical protein